MKKLALAAALTACLSGVAHAQNDYYTQLAKRQMQSKAQMTFNANEAMLNIRNYVTLKEGELILEMGNLNDYNNFRNMDSILLQFRKDIAFFKDSLDNNPTGNVRIDYNYAPGFTYKKLRFKEYYPDGAMFLNNNGDVSRLKMAQDTIRIIIETQEPGIGPKRNGGCMISYAIQATLLLNNYYDVDKIIDSHELDGVIDTLLAASQNRKYKATGVYTHPFSVIYNPYFTGKGRLKKFDRLIMNEYDQGANKNRWLTMKAYLGEGLVRYNVATMGELGFQYNAERHYASGITDHNIIRLTVAPYYFFTPNGPGSYAINDNWFINASVGAISNKDMEGWMGKAGTFGVGYLVAEKGGYFKNTTFKIFTDLVFVKGLTIAPEILFTDNCKQIFPGFTVKVF